MKRCPSCEQTYPGNQTLYCPSDGAALETIADEPRGSLIGSVLDSKYVIESLIGEGGMGAVYRARHLLLERDVAVKVLRADVVGDATAAARFKREAQAAARLVHPNAVAIHDFGISPEGSAYLVMELLEGTSLRKRIDTAGQLPLKEIETVLSQVCDAMDTAHKLGIVHRDLKPDNIIISDKNGVVKVVDFGIAMLQDAAQGTGRLTGTGMVVGTANYMSPEHCRGIEVDARSDIYSLGVVLFEMLTGRAPFNAPFPSAVIIAHVNEAPPAPHTLRPDVSPSVEHVVLEALAKKPADRPQTASAFAARLRLSIAGDTSPNPTASPSAPMRVDPTGIAHRAATMGHSEWQQQQSNATIQHGSWNVPPGPFAPMPPTQYVAPQARKAGMSGVLMGMIAIGSLLVIGGVLVAFYSMANNGTPPIVSSAPQPQPSTPLPTAVHNPDPGTTTVEPPRPAPPMIGSITGEVPADAAEGQVALTAAEIDEVEEFLADWVSSAMARDVNWNASMYGDVVDYYEAGPVPKAKVRADRLRAYEKFDTLDIEIPVVHEATATSDGSQIRIVFDKKWVFRGREGDSNGKVKALLELQRVDKTLRIVTEKDLQVY